MSASLATAPSEPTNREPLDNPVAARALEWARQWYPPGQFALTSASDHEATVLVEVEGSVFTVHYEDLDRGPRCEWCGRPL